MYTTMYKLTATPSAEVFIMKCVALEEIPFQTAPYLGLEHNGLITVRSDVVFGGPSVEPTADRRLYLEVHELEHLLSLARQSPTRRVQIDHAGMRVRRVLDGSHTVEVLSIVGSAPKPEPFSLAGVR